MGTKNEVNNIEDATSHPPKSHDVNAHVVPMQQEAQEDLIHIDLTWRSWMVVFVSCFACAVLSLSQPNLTDSTQVSWRRFTLWWQLEV